MAYYSLGCSCLPKFGIDEYVGKVPTYFFDWLITDMQALQNSLVKFNEDLFLRSGWEICDNELMVKDFHTGLKFQHDFPVSSDGKVDSQRVEENIQLVRDRYIRRRNRFFDALNDDENPILIRYEYKIGCEEKNMRPTCGV